MKKVYEGRILGMGLLMAVIGIVGFLAVGSDVAYILIFFFLMWLFNYDLSSYDAKYDENGNERVSGK